MPHISNLEAGLSAAASIRCVLILALVLGAALLLTTAPASAQTPTPTPTAMPTATPIPAQLTRDQQACVNEMNKNGEKVNRTQLKENEWCLNRFQRENLDQPTFDACTTDDFRDRVTRAEERTVTREIRKCDPLVVPPPYAYTDAATVNAAGVNHALWLLYQIFGGPPVDDADLFTKATNNDTANCQREMLRRANNLENTVLRAVNRAKRQALRDETVDSKAALEDKLRDVLSSNARIKRTEDKLVRRVDRMCNALLALPDTIFPGVCANPDLSVVEDCVIAAARCEACLKINAFDALDLDCDQADDQDNTNGSCM